MDTPKYNGQSQEDKFVLNTLQFKKNGYFLEIGSGHPVLSNSTYVLESQYNWRVLIVDFDHDLVSQYKELRPKCIQHYDDASQFDYASIFKANSVPRKLDYLHINLVESNGSAIQTLQNLDSTVFDRYTFATVTFKHDTYYSNDHNTRVISREIFKKRGYVPVFLDVNNDGIQYQYQDWYVHPTLVNMEYVQKLIDLNSSKNLTYLSTGTTISWAQIEYQ